ncbi:putative GPI anchored protein [Aspergillus fischeri NRRL 181]|uniref:GPI anchored protein, putative n=1 Tax=Neosartorya fischeri (strain ATCC 1020 / DSM 3700 / CBS 544.65 / FGSC A1164 / JCM 1740 / NRRL 181 / WB 181) TaxID=331117 RepID=A1D9T1_NEOFI|nr:GPI anchored protein, putative [Aspergillus fischeri NRRL 181]EAW20562.1 GPI anchored protein, putative [Aspergillus fischeri NRRL 181]KAG2025226.1 hypothetical protein GB937_002987 [Aspergillus fischeri]
MLLSLVTVISVFQLAIATNLNPPILYSRHAAQEGSLEKRETCEDGAQCLLGSCCGDGCALNCCALDNGGLGCGIAERCQFRGNVFVGCCGNFLGGCTGEATHVTVHTPYSTVTLGAPTDAMTTGTSTTTTEQMFTAISVTPTATATATGSTSTTTTTSSESESETGSSSHSHRVSASSTSVEAETTSSTSHRRTTTTAAFSQASPSPNNGGGSGVGVEAPVLAGMVALGAVLL